MSRVSGGDLLCRCLVAQGVHHVFGLPGTQNVPLFESLRTSTLTVVIPTHELAAGFMAHGYYRATGKLPVVVTIPGPGFTYLTTALAEAKHDSVAILYITITPESIPGKNFCLQELPQSGMVRPLVKDVVRIQRCDDIQQKISEAILLAMSGEPGPVYVEIDSSAIRAEVQQKGAVDCTVAQTSRIIGDTASAAAFIKSGSRIAVFTGAGAFGAITEIGQLLTTTGAPLVTTCSGRGLLPEDDTHNLTIDLSTGGVEELNELFEVADRVIVVGAKLGHNGSGGFGLRIPREKLLRIDASEEVVGCNYPAEHALVGDAGEVLRALLPYLEGYTTGWTEPRGKAIRGLPEILPATRDEAGAEVRIDTFIARLRAAFPRDAICVTDSGWHQMLMRRFFPVFIPRGLIVPSDFQSMGYGIPAACGAALAVPGKSILCVLGDGGLLMAGMDLATAVRLGLQITFVVFRDGHYGLIRLQQAKGYGETFGTELPNIDYHALCDSLGVAYHYGPSLGDAGLRAISEGRGISLIEVPLIDKPAFGKLRNKTRFKRSLRRMIMSSGIGNLRNLFRKASI